MQRQPLSPLKSVLINTALVIASIAILWLALEGMARVYEWKVGRIRPSAPPSTVDPHTPWLGAPYYDEAFIEAHRNDSVTGAIVFEDKNYYLPKNGSSALYNVKDNRRFTTDTPANPAFNILLFGGSTMYCREVPDALTIASQLQRLINGRFNARVENFGVRSANTLQQYNRLKDTKLSPGDVVIFYGGFNDGYYSIYSGNHQGNLPDVQRSGNADGLPFSARLLTTIYNKYAGRSAFLRVMLTKRFQEMTSSTPPTVSDDKLLQENLKRLETDYADIISKAQQYTTSQGAIFINILQPHLFSLQATTDYEKQLITDMLNGHKGLAKAIGAAYEAMGASARKLQSDGIRTFDLSGVFNGTATDIYFDYCHVNHTGNEVVADAIFSILNEELSNDPS